MLAKQEEIQDLISKILGDEAYIFQMEDYTFLEKLKSQSCQLDAIIQARKTSNQAIVQSYTLSGRGVGPIDAFFESVFNILVPEYPSLENTHFSYFKIKGNFNTSQAFSRADATAEVHIGMENSLGKEFRFSAMESRSIVHGSFDCILQAAAYFVNAERTFSILYQHYLQAKKDNKEEKTSYFTKLMADMVENAPYTATIERLKKISGKS